MDDPIVVGALLSMLGLIAAGLIAGTFTLVRQNGKRNNPGLPCETFGGKLDQVAVKLDEAIGELRELVGMMRERGR